MGTKFFGGCRGRPGRVQRLMGLFASTCRPFRNEGVNVSSYPAHSPLLTVVGFGLLKLTVSKVYSVGKRIEKCRALTQKGDRCQSVLKFCASWISKRIWVAVQWLEVVLTWSP